jgi:NAD(P)-dependent dehydrogenase (short-subunit alcohol dehydrogenase family)
MSSLQGKTVVVIGGSSGIGLATAKLALEQGADVVIASRSEQKLRHAQELLGSNVSTYVLDTTREQDVKAFFADHVQQFDHLVVTAAETSGGAFLTTETEKARQLFENKFWGQYFAAKYGALHLSSQGSITLFSGVVAFKAMVGSAVLGAVNAAVANLGQTLALELAPIRVNVVSPGIIDTPARAHLPADARAAMLESVASKLPVARVGLADDVAEGVIYLLKNGFTTGTTLHVDGGHSVT